jgi:hypothetical protein
LNYKLTPISSRLGIKFGVKKAPAGPDTMAYRSDGDIRKEATFSGVAAGEEADEDKFIKATSAFLSLFLFLWQ